MVMQGGNGVGPYTGPSMVVGSPSEFADSEFVANASVWTVEPLTVVRHQNLCYSVCRGQAQDAAITTWQSVHAKAANVQ
jgi:hypothetical protein